MYRKGKGTVYPRTSHEDQEGEQNNAGINHRDFKFSVKKKKLKIF